MHTAFEQDCATRAFDTRSAYASGVKRMSSSDRLEQLKQEVTVHAGPSQADLHAADARDNRGRSADTPTQIPLPGWKDVALRSYYVIVDFH
jgi:hypothetical protein